MIKSGNRQLCAVVAPRLFTEAPRMALDLDTLALRSGSHSSPSLGVSLMEAVSVLAGEPWSNSPSCRSAVIAAYARSLNDSTLAAWSAAESAQAASRSADRAA